MTTTRVCTNGKCPAYARVIYTGATRCDFCRWDLKAAQRNIAAAVGDGGHAAKAPASVQHSRFDVARGSV
jgi:hypothetical protein